MHDAKQRAQETYNAAAEFFDEPALGFWDRFGRATVDRLELRPGATVLDACAGSGASALPAAERVGPSGKVVAVDLADNLLALARAKADRHGVGNLETRHGDVEALDYAPGSFDAVIIVFGVFFLPDMAAGTAALWRLVAPGGQLAVTTWGSGVFEPANSEFWDAVDQVRPDLTRAYNPWDSLPDPDADLGPDVEEGALSFVVAGAVLVGWPEVPDDDRSIYRGHDLAERHVARRSGEHIAAADASL